MRRRRIDKKSSFSEKILVLISVILVLISFPYRNQDKSKWKSKQNSVSAYDRKIYLTSAVFREIIYAKRKIDVLPVSNGTRALRN